MNLAGLINKPFRVLAIDPGLSGAVALVGKGELKAIRDFDEYYDISAAVSNLAPEADHAIIERVGARPGQGVVSMFNFGKATGVAIGTVFSCCLDWQHVTPQKWQNWFREQLNIQRPAPFDSREIALRLFPAHGFLFKRKKDHNTADAVLIALWKLNQLN